MVINLSKPVIYVFKRVHIKHVENKHNTVGTFIVSIRDGPISLLPSSIPDLQLQLLTTVSERPKPEVHSDSGHVILIKLIISEPDKEATFTHTGVS